ncbi:MAG: hypothetical protein L0J18_12520 [Tetragenococcus koreensis]|nr:hypothetical protein [Tetragenococcus koreensis]
MYFYDIEEIKNLMKEKNLNIRQLSININLPYDTVYQVISGRRSVENVTIRVYKKIVNELWKEA